MSKHWIFLLIFLLSFQEIFSQRKDFQTDESELINLGLSLLNSKNEDERLNANIAFIEKLEKIIAIPESFFYPFDSLVTIAKLLAPDNTFRILNWHVPKDDGTFQFFGYIQLNPQFIKSRKLPAFHKLINSHNATKAIENKTLGAQEWLGAHYYKIIQPSKKEKNYVLLGWDGNTAYSNKKLIETLFFTPNGEPKFGASIFKMDNRKTQKRIIFEYAESASMSLKYHEEMKQIIFDHLAPAANQYKDHYQFYGPDFSFDAFIYKKGNWILLTDIDTKNRNLGKEKNWNNPKNP
jgi:hypothetical protein